MTAIEATIRGSAWSDASGIAAVVQHSVVMVRSRAGAGAGTAWRADGLVVTNSHVVRDDRVQVVTHDGQAHTARLVARDQRRDLALLQVDGAALMPAMVRDSATVRVGELVFAVGNPWGRAREVTFGIVTGTEAAAIGSDVRLAPGNSGGPLADAQGRVIGINSMIAYGMAVAVPSNAVLDLIAGTQTQRGWLGIEALPVPIPEVGVGLLINDVHDNGAAARAGLIVGDILVAIDGAAGNLDALGEALSRIIAGEDVRLDFLRGGAPRNVVVTAAAER
jgi:serine protease Do